MSDDLARRAVACRHWRWLPGMRCLDGSRMLRAGSDLSGPYQAWSDEHYDACACKMRPEETRDDLPDLSDPATLGALLALVREAGAYIRHLSMLPMGCTVNVAWPDGRICDYHRETLAEALVAALEAAP